MLTFKNIEKEQFDSFVRSHKTKSHFLQSLAWGEFSKIKKNVTPHYLGLVNENNEVVAGTLLLEKKLPLNLCYFYAPRGFVLDYKKKETVKRTWFKMYSYRSGGQDSGYFTLGNREEDTVIRNMSSDCEIDVSGRIYIDEFPF